MDLKEKYPLALPVNTVLAGKYVITNILGQGGFGITYKAKNYVSGEEVAIKEFFPDSLATRTGTTVTSFSGEKKEYFEYGKSCFIQEAETLAQFGNVDGVVNIQSYFEENETAYFVMEFIEGTSFDSYLKQQGGRISYDEAERILLPVIEALEQVHNQGIVHRDVTPDNIYITKDGSIKLLDFGAARYSLGDKSQSLDVILKHGFAPKEQYSRRGRQGPYTDVYTVGACFYVSLTGKRPPDSIDRMDEDDMVPPRQCGVEISESLENVILMAMAVQPANRFQTMKAFKSALLNAKNAGRISPAVEAPGKAEQGPVMAADKEAEQGPVMAADKEAEPSAVVMTSAKVDQGSATPITKKRVKNFALINAAVVFLLEAIFLELLLEPLARNFGALVLGALPLVAGTIFVVIGGMNRKKQMKYKACWNIGFSMYSLAAAVIFYLLNLYFSRRQMDVDSYRFGDAFLTASIPLLFVGLLWKEREAFSAQGSLVSSQKKKNYLVLINIATAFAFSAYGIWMFWTGVNGTLYIRPFIIIGPVLIIAGIVQKVRKKKHMALWNIGFATLFMSLGYWIMVFTRNILTGRKRFCFCWRAL